MEQIFKTVIILFSIEACVSSKNNTTIYACYGENVTLSCPPAGVNKTVTWFRRNVSKNSIATLYAGSKGKDANLPSNTADNVNEENGEFNLTIMNLTKADNGTYKCFHDKNFTSWLFHLTIKDPDHEYNSGSQTEGNNIFCTSNVFEHITGVGVFTIDTNVHENNDDVLNMMWWYVMCCGLIAAGIAILSYKYPTFHKGMSRGSASRKFANILKEEDVRAKTSNDYFKSVTYSNVYENLESSLIDFHLGDNFLKRILKRKEKNMFALIGHFTSHFYANEFGNPT